MKMFSRYFVDMIRIHSRDSWFNALFGFKDTFWIHSWIHGLMHLPGLAVFTRVHSGVNA